MVDFCNYRAVVQFIIMKSITFYLLLTVNATVLGKTETVTTVNDNV